MTDLELGSQHGRLGFEAKYPNNVNYMDGFAAGMKAAEREYYRTRLDDDYAPPGVSDAHFDQFHNF